MMPALMSTSAWVLLVSGERLRVQLTKVARRPVKSNAAISGSVMDRLCPLRSVAAMARSALRAVNLHNR